MKKILLIITLLAGFLYPQTEVFIIRNKVDTLRIDVNDLKSGLGGSLIPPSDLIADGDTNRFILTWNDNSSNEEGFYLSISSDGNNWVTPIILPANTTTYNYPLIGNGITRYFRISAFLGALETQKILSEPATTLDLRDLTPPYLPYNVLAVGGNKLITITWDDSSSDASLYYIYRSVTDVPAELLPYDSTVNKSYVDINCTSKPEEACWEMGFSETWYYRIKSRDALYNYTDYSLSDSGTTNAQVIQDTAGTANPYILSVLFENGDLSEFTSTSGTNYSATTNAKYNGNYGGEMYFDGATNTSYGIANFSYPDTTWISFRVKFSSAIRSGAPWNYYSIVEFNNGTDYNFKFVVKANASNVPYIWGAYYRDATGIASYTSSTNFSADAWHLIEIKYKKDATVGGAVIYVDSTYIGSISQLNRNTSANTTTNLRFGSTYVTGIWSGGSTYFDNIYADTTRLGSIADTTTIINPDITPPTAPTNFTATGKYDVNTTPNLSFVDVNWTDASSDEAKFYIYRGTKDIYGGNLTLKDSVNANVTTWRDNTIPLTDTLHYYQYGISARDASYNYSPISTAQRDSAYLPGKPIISGGGTETYAGKSWFVNTNSTGVSTGKSWTTAFRTLDDSSATNPDGLNWNVITAGDTIWVAGGNYVSFTPKKNGSAGNYIVITGTNKAPYNTPVNMSGVIEISSRSYLKLRKFKFTGTTSSDRVHIRFCHDITCDSLNMPDLRGRGFQIEDNTGNIIVENSYIIGGTASTSQTDGIYSQRNVVSATNPAIIIRNNYIEIANVALGAHNDCVQSYQDGDPANANRETYLMYNNICYQRRTEQGNSSITMNNTGDGWYTYYNNITIQPYSWVVGLGGQNSTATATNEKVRIIHNTFIGGLYQGKNIYARYSDAADSFMVYNNIVTTKLSGSLCMIDDAPSMTISAWDYNKYYSYSGSWGGTIIGGNTYGSQSLSQWQARGYDTHSSTGDPLFTNYKCDLTGVGDYTLQAGSTAKNAGLNLQTLIESIGLEWKNINGTPRDSTPDLGAY